MRSTVTAASWRFSAPAAGKAGDLKRYLVLFCCFLQPSPENIRSAVLYAIKHFLPGYADRVEAAPPESRPS